MNISIISDCNGECSFCFQKEYHKKHLMLSWEELEDIIRWGEGEPLALLGGEPTLHPDIVKLMHRLNEVLEKSSLPSALLITNMLGPTEVFKELAKIKNLRILANTNYPDKLKDHYHNNFSELMKTKSLEEDKIYTAGITLTGFQDQDNLYIERLFETLSLYNEIIKEVRLGICTPFHEQDYKLINHDETIRYIVNRTNKEYENITCHFDCSTNNCQISHKLKCELSLNNNFILHDSKHSCKAPIIDIMADKSVIYCSSCPSGFLKIDDYRQFEHVHECRFWYEKQRTKYISESKSYCIKLNGEKPDCDYCNGCCIAINQYMKKKLK